MSKTFIHETAIVDDGAVLGWVHVFGTGFTFVPEQRLEKMFLWAKRICR